MRGLLVLLLLTGACQRKAAVPTCEAMADHVLELMTPSDDFGRAIRNVFAKRCTEDAWSEEVRSCIGDTKSLGEPQNCKRKLVADQAKKLETELAAAERREAGKVVPPVCGRYEQVLAQILACDKVAQDLRDGLRKRFAEAKANWATMPDKTELGEVCASGIRLLKQAGADCPGSDKW